MAILWAIIRTARPAQWLKNLALFAPLVFTGKLFAPEAFDLVFQSALVFIVLSSTTYFFNDLLDIEADRHHPIKKNRPIASGALPVPLALLILVASVIAGLTWSYLLSYYLFLCALAYLIVQVFYSTTLKKIAIIDVIVIAIGYLLRVYAGAFVIQAHMDVWFLLTVISVSLFLAVGKRRGEMTLLQGREGTRATLKRYTESLLDIYMGMFSTATWITYALFTFNHPRIIPDGRALILLSILPRTLASEKWMMATIPLVVYGVMRYLQLIYEKNEGESPEKILLSDKPLIITVVLWMIAVVGIIYYIA